MEVFTGSTCTIAGKEIKLQQERYKVLVVPPLEVIPHETLARVKEFFEAGGIVVGCGFLPTKSATIGKTAADVAALRTAVWGETPAPGTKACKLSPAGGRAYLLGERPTSAEIAETLTGEVRALEAMRAADARLGEMMARKVQLDARLARLRLERQRRRDRHRSGF